MKVQELISIISSLENSLELQSSIQKVIDELKESNLNYPEELNKDLHYITEEINTSFKEFENGSGIKVELDRPYLFQLKLKLEDVLAEEIVLSDMIKNTGHDDESLKYEQEQKIEMMLLDLKEDYKVKTVGLKI